MRFLGFAFVSSAIVLGACSGGGEQKADSPATAAPAARAPASFDQARRPGGDGFASQEFSQFTGELARGLVSPFRSLL